MKPEIYMWEGTREHLLERHDAYVEALKERVFPIFADIDSEAETFTDDKYQELMSLPCWDENTDPSIIAEMAQDAGIAKYETLGFLKHEMLLGALAGLYHLWERSLRDFLEHEFRHWMRREIVHKCAWEANIGRIYELLASFGWDVRHEPFFAEMDACRLIVNVYKHGKGTSIAEPTSKYPKYLRHPLGLDIDDAFGRELLDHEDLKVLVSDILQMAASFRQFWQQFPERLLIQESTMVEP
jgi:hypothetical protein